VAPTVGEVKTGGVVVVECRIRSPVFIVFITLVDTEVIQMSKFFWSTSSGTIANFNSESDIFIFDLDGGEEISAAQVTFEESGSDVTMKIGGKTVTLAGMTLAELTSTTATALGNIRFNDESKLIVGDNSVTGTLDNSANTLTGGIGNDQLLGLGGNDNLSGGAGNDLLDGGTGNDIMNGGTGNDTYMVDSSSDSITDSAGTDEVQASASYTLGTNVEKLTLTGTSNINGTGNTLANIITGNIGNNTLSGGTDSAIDTLIGGLGNDTYVVGLNDLVDEVTGGGGTDTVQASVSYNLSSAANVENLTLTGTAATGTGNSSDNFITGNAFANTLIGLGGNDTYVVSTGDTVTEQAGGGTDEIWASVSYSLTSAANVENLTLTGLSAISGTGNDSPNVITGNDAVNTLNGGLGADTLIGGAGNDIYVVGTGDVITEATGGGTDLVQASVDYTLGDNVENLTLGGTSPLNGTGNGSANVITGNSAASTLTGLGGNDTYVVSNASTDIIEATGGGTDQVNASVSYTLGAQVENLTLTGTATNGTGNGLANEITGTSVANILDGKVGADMLKGLAGNDTYVVDNAGDVVTELAGGGTDLVQASVDYILDANVENLTLTGTAAIGTGNSLNNVITGNAAVADTLTGGLGNDTYVVNNAGDDVIEQTSEGTDLVQASVSYTLGATTDVENLTLIGTAAIGTGNTLANTITGNTGNNTLSGGTDSAIDTLVGGAGNDTYVVGTGDVVTELAGGGTDLVKASVDYTLGTNVENLELTGTSALSGTGNTLANTITGNSAASILTGLAGNDTYVVSNASTDIVEVTGGGTDLVKASVDYVLDDNVENLTLTGSSPLDGTGNALANTITGNSGINTLSGGTDALVDTLVGGAGNDIYVVGTGDVVTELASQGVDLVEASVSYTLGANVEKLTLQGTEAINGTGNTTANTITGNSGDNILSGGAGVDTLTGGGGNDTFKGQGGNDNITLGAGTDTVVFESTKALNGLDSVDGFSLAGGDKLDFNLFFGAATNISVLPTVNANSTGAIAVATGNVLQVNNDIGTITATEIANMFGEGKTFEAAQFGEKFVVITAAAAGAASVWYVDTTLNGFGGDLELEDVVQVVNLVGVNNLVTTPLTVDNIVA
jgi:Ca2+-binding RTX toxin-like protein